MPEITLVVTQAVLTHTAQRPAEQQIAIRSATPDIWPIISQLTRTNQATITLGGCIDLAVGDPGAIWRAHNAQQVQDFEALFNLLARRPDQDMRFLCTI